MLWDSGKIESALALGWGDIHNPLLVALLLPILGLAINVVIQVLLLRLSRGRDFMRSLAFGFLVGGLSTVAGYLVAARAWCSVPAGEPPLGLLLLEWLLLVAPAYAGLGYGYANFANLGHSSIRIRLYEELRLAPEGRLLAELRQRHDEAGILKSRLQRLAEGGDLVQADNLWKVGRRRFVLLGAIIFFAKQLTLRRASEFDPPPAG